jgi:hypothetical protein
LNTERRAEAVVAALRALAEAIRKASEIPSGHLFARVVAGAPGVGSPA